VLRDLDRKFCFADRSWSNDRQDPHNAEVTELEKTQNTLKGKSLGNIVFRAEHELRVRETILEVNTKKCEELLKLGLKNDDSNPTETQKRTKGYWTFPVLMRGSNKDYSQNCADQRGNKDGR
jgi:hypothetical protein